MSWTLKAGAADAAAGPAGGCTVTVCRGCCCGQAEKNPRTDHAAQVRQLRETLPSGAKLRQSDCLDVCERSNVIVIGPSPAGRIAGARPVWLGFVNDQDAISEIAAWIASGGPGVSGPPPALELYEFSPSRRVRVKLDPSTGRPPTP